MTCALRSLVGIDSTSRASDKPRHPAFLCKYQNSIQRNYKTCLAGFSGFFSRYLYLKNATSILLKIDCKYTTIFGTISCLKCVKHSWTQVWNFKLKFFYNLQETTHTVPKIIWISPWKSSLSRLKHLTRNFSAFCDRNMCAAQLVNNSYPLTRTSALAVTGSVFMPQFRFLGGECALICFQ